MTAPDIAGALDRHRIVTDYRGEIIGCSCRAGIVATARSHRAHVAAALHAELVAAQAEAWDEGYRQGVNDEATSQDWTGGQVSPARRNPYRAALAALAQAGGGES